MSLVSLVRNLADGRGGRHLMDLPVFVVTDSVPEEWVYQGIPFTFVTSDHQNANDVLRGAGSGDSVDLDPSFRVSTEGGSVLPI